MEWHNGTEEDAAECLARLLKVDTCNPPGGEEKLAAVIAGLLAEDSVPAKILPLGGGRANLVAEISGDGDETVGFFGHMDTVPTGDPAGWRFPPFAARRGEDGRVYGRGAADMRGGLAAMLMLCRHYAPGRRRPPVTLRFCFTADEESGGAGITALRDGGWLRGLTEAFICEPTDLRPGTREKGALWVQTHVGGRSSHASMPREGVNALESGIRFFTEIQKLVENIPSDPLLGRSTCSLTRARAGDKINMIPAAADLAADLRYGPAADGGALKAAILAAARAAARPGGPTVETAFSNDRSALSADPESPMLRRLRRVYAAAGLAFEPVGIQFYTDASLFVPQTGLPFVILGPGEQAQCHRTDESIDPGQIPRAFALYREYVETLGRERGARQ